MIVHNNISLYSLDKNVYSIFLNCLNKECKLYICTYSMILCMPNFHALLLQLFANSIAKNRTNHKQLYVYHHK